MVEWLTVIGLITLGALLVMVEIILIPGTTLVGIAGLLFNLAGIYFGFEYFGTAVGFIILGVALTGNVFLVMYSFRMKAWERFSLKNKADSRVNEGIHSALKIGQKGISLSALRPVGKAEFEGKTYEVRTIGPYMDRGVELEIIKIEPDRIIVQPII
jgi:membrane-bound ClpP family serine protease